MKNRSASVSLAVNTWSANLPQILVLAIALILLLGMVLADTTDELVAYLLMAITSFGPAVVWIRTGSAGVPIMAGTSIFYFVYYGVPIIRKNADLAEYGSQEIL